MPYDSSKMVPLKGLKPVLYVRRADMDDAEYTAAEKFFHIVTQRTEVAPGSKVIPRYTALPFFHELCVDLRNMRARCINNYRQHQYVADLKNWVDDFGGLTPWTWERLEDVPDEAFPVVLKGATNSMKERWDTHVFAKDRAAAVKVLLRLQADSLIGRQQIYIRKWVPLHTFMNGIGGIPITKEYRLFFAFGELLAGGYYWQNYEEDVRNLGFRPDVKRDVPQRLIEEIGSRLKDKVNFVVADVAQMRNGDWILVELNDGQQSGLSCVDPVELYQQLFIVTAEREFGLS